MAEGLRHGPPSSYSRTKISIRQHPRPSSAGSSTRVREGGADQLVGGDPERQVLPPHVFTGVDNQMSTAQQETFGPLAPIIQVNGDDEALRVANETPYGLSSAVFSGDEERGQRFALGIRAGMTHINDHSVDDTAFSWPYVHGAGI